MTDAQPELKPCPFCGGTADTVVGTRGKDYIAYVKCNECDAIGEKFRFNSVDGVMDLAKLSWNRRIEPQNFSPLFDKYSELQAKYEKTIEFINELAYILEHKPERPLLSWCLEAEALLKELGEDVK